MEDPKISIIIPVYNVEAYLQRCLDSILNQTFRDFEVILVDDGSTDHSGFICDEYAKRDERVKVFHKENGGVSSARNFGIEKAKGAYISFVDSDDWVENNFYEMLVDKIKTTDLTYVSDIHHFLDGTEVSHLMHEGSSFTREQVENEILYLKSNNAGYPFFGYTWNKLFRADIIREHNIRFIEDLSLCEDEAFTDDYCKYIGSISLISEPLYHYRAGLLGLTGKKKKEKEYFLLINNIRKAISYYKNPELTNYEQKRIGFFSLQCFSEWGTESQNYVKELELLKLSKGFPSVQLGMKANLVLSLKKYSKFFLKLYRLVFRRNFI